MHVTELRTGSKFTITLTVTNTAVALFSFTPMIGFSVGDQLVTKTQQTIQDLSQENGSSETGTDPLPHIITEFVGKLKQFFSSRS